MTTDHMGAVLHINEPKLDKMPAEAQPDGSIIEFKIKKPKIPTKKPTNQRNEGISNNYRGNYRGQVEKARRSVPVTPIGRIPEE